MAILTGVHAVPVARRTALTGFGLVGAAAAVCSGAWSAVAGRAALAVPSGAAAGAAMPAAAAAMVDSGVAETVKVSIQVNKTALVAQLYDYFADPSPTSRKQRSVVADFTGATRLNMPYQLLEAVVIEGDLTHEDVNAFVTGLLEGRENVEVVG
jgi:hypothetical protein